MCDRRLSLLALFLLVAGCGGGGGSGESPAPIAGPSPAPGPSPSPQTGSISGSVSSIAGVPVQGVQVVIVGATSGSTVTNASGAYSLASLPPGSYTVEPRANGLIFSPTTTSVSVVGNSDIRASFAATYQSTETIANYMGITHAQGRSAFFSREDALGAQLSAIGQFRSGNHYSRSISENFLPMVDSFISNSLQYIQNLSSTGFIDPPAVAGLFRTYSTRDVDYSRTYYSGVNWGLGSNSSGLAQVLAELKGQIEQKYAAAISRFQ